MNIDSTALIHPAAAIEDGARIGAGTRIGPFAVIGAEVEIGADCVVKPHAIVTGSTRLGDGCTVFPFAVLGEIPQDLKFAGERTRLEIGARCRIREHVTMNTGTDGGGGVTRVGDDCLFMAGAHVAHDAQVGHRVIMANNAALAGHCVIGDDVIVGGLAGVHQFVRIGRGAIIGAVTMVTHDVIPYALVQAPRGEVDGLNLIGLKRRGVDRADIAALRAALQVLRDGEGAFQDRARRLGDTSDSAYVREIADFVLGGSGRGFLTPR
ncbi:UDP-N-acetylglucosamine acyltransferase [Oceaniovalibus guishaninsula JLT2003]|uniref:Acyl-[acyl-carrier-protein]--UDP-N-acetylglucosamine O-acyltransferase n=1 Tax=Oceaniovalibus guishaninsula JLT2003 TaxID=1231392 RepID=K2I441_9RHOB|nr:acyl-ACP--UDP-N-acetylglucosamine O-acyltransferase [Oceaniovalibus guishaninsula]EKE43610.1 UDP-N-acetylglucosamine acyltransferase [Oceaniovalibus guishaninsula JLT2003]